MTVKMNVQAGAQAAAPRLEEIRRSVEMITRTSEEVARLSAVRVGTLQTSSLLSEGVARIVSMIEAEMVQVRAMSDRVDRLTEGITARTGEVIRMLDAEIDQLNCQMEAELDAALALMGGEDEC